MPMVLGSGSGLSRFTYSSKESLEDGVLAAVPGVHHGAAVSRAAPDLRSRGRFPALLHDQLSRGVQ